MELFALRLKEVMAQKNITHKKLGELVGLDRKSITNIIGGKVMPSLPVFVKICQVTKESADYLLGFVDV